MLPNHKFFFPETGTLIRTALLIAALAPLPETVDAVPLYSGFIAGVETVNASPNPVFLSNLTERVDRDGLGNVVGEGNIQAVAAASYGQARGSSTADYLNVSESLPIDTGIGTQEGSDFNLDDLVISGPPGNIMVSFNFVISGSIGTTTESTGGSAYYFSWAHVDARIVTLQSSFGGGGMDLGKIDVNSVSNASRTGIFSTFPVNFSGSVTGTTPVITTYAGDAALQLWLGLATGAGASAGRGAGAGWTNGHAAFSFGFPTSGPVANLPEGYTLNSADGRIVDNRFVPIASDFNGDSVVDGDDLTQWQGAFGANFGADADADGDSDGGDFLAWQQQFGSPALAVAANAPVPEPTSLALCVASLFAIRFLRVTAGV